jgi:hypothetical protein
MAWKIHFNGQEFGPLSDADTENIKDSIVTAARDGEVVVFGSVLHDTQIDGIWTTGAPISFEHLTED